MELIEIKKDIDNSVVSLSLIASILRDNYNNSKIVSILKKSLGNKYRKIESTFQLTYGYSFKDYFVIGRFYKAFQLLKQKQELRNYYSIAIKLGYEDEKSLHSLIKGKTNMTTMEFHRFLLKNKEITFDDILKMFHHKPFYMNS